MQNVLNVCHRQLKPTGQLLVIIVAICIGGYRFQSAAVLVQNMFQIAANVLVNIPTGKIVAVILSIGFAYHFQRNLQTATDFIQNILSS